MSERNGNEVHSIGGAEIRITRDWFKSTSSSGSCACVEVRFGRRSVAIRDSKNRLDSEFAEPLEPTIEVSVDTWLAFLDEVLGRATPGVNAELAVSENAGRFTFTSLADGTQLTYTSEEWTAFVAGVEKGEFTPELVST